MEQPKIVKVKLYRDEAKEWRFSAFSANGEVIVVSSEGYKNHGDALACVLSLWPGIEVVA